MTGIIADKNLAPQGKASYDWARAHMQIFNSIMEKYQSSKPLRGIKLAFCLHITKETSVLVMSAQKLGAKIAICSANPLSTQDDIAAFLSSKNILTYAWRGESDSEYRECIMKVLQFGPNIVTDDGGDMHNTIFQVPSLKILGGTEETTSGLARLRILHSSGKLNYPVVAVNDASTKHLFDNRYGTGQSAIDGLLRATGLLLAGKHVIVCGYGWVGKGIASRARGMGAIVSVTEVDPLRAMEASMDGYTVSKLSICAGYADFIITCTGQKHVISISEIIKMKSGVILANAGHFDTEIDIHSLHSKDKFPIQVRPYVEQFTIQRKLVYLISRGRVLNLVGSEGSPPEVMSLSFANQLLSIIYIAKNYSKMLPGIYCVPKEIDNYVAEAALRGMNIEIDKLSKMQRRYIGRQ
ncbi:MAG TPA: adenosylhomocysteinase [Nitrososphaeraceae archaeon]|jgi:adenosylhomocysteinase